MAYGLEEKKIQVGKISFLDTGKEDSSFYYLRRTSDPYKEPKEGKK